MKTLIVDDTGNPITMKLSASPKKWEQEYCGFTGNFVTTQFGIKCIVELNAFMPILNIRAINIKTNEDLFKMKSFEYGASPKKDWSHVLAVYRKEFKKLGIKLDIVND